MREYYRQLRQPLIFMEGFLFTVLFILFLGRHLYLAVVGIVLFLLLGLLLTPLFQWLTAQKFPAGKIDHDLRENMFLILVTPLILLLLLLL